MSALPFKMFEYISEYYTPPHTALQLAITSRKSGRRGGGGDKTQTYMLHGYVAL